MVLPLHGVPRALDVELPRLRLVDRLRQSWARPITLVVAGPGFGKTTALAQAVRANLLEPRGIDAWVTCGPATRTRAGWRARSWPPSPSRPAPGGRRAGRPRGVAALRPAGRVPAARRRPRDPPDSPGATLLAAVARALPGTAHLVLSGRRTPDLPLARREAAGELAALGAEELAFTDAETAALATRFGRELPQDLHGWPALIRLSLCGGPRRVLALRRGGGAPAARRAGANTLAALVTLGCATTEEVGTVADAPVISNASLAGCRWSSGSTTADTGRTTCGPIVRAGRSLRAKAVEVLSARGELAGAGNRLPGARLAAAGASRGRARADHVVGVALRDRPAVAEIGARARARSRRSSCSRPR